MNSFRKRFPLIVKNPNLIYFDNAATTLKPKEVIHAEVFYLENIGANPHTNDFKKASDANEIISATRSKTANFINAYSSKEVVFTSGTTFSINQIAFGLKKYLQIGDEILVTSVEHSANLLPWIEVAKQTNCEVKKMKLEKNFTIDLENLKRTVTSQTKVVAFSHISNTFGAKNDVKEIAKIIRSINPQAIIVVDAAQSVGHTEIDVQAWDIDFLAFSAHKMYGPFGLGILWGRFKILDEFDPLLYGGGMSLIIENNLKDYILSSTPNKFEGGTPNISAIYAFKSAIEFIEEITFAKIEAHEQMLKKYFAEQVRINNLAAIIDFYNLGNLSPLVILNAKGINPQDVATFLDIKYNIATRSGSHCARRTSDIIETKVSLRLSFALYNTTEEIDILVNALKHVKDFLEVLF